MDLTGTQIKNTYGNVITIGAAAGTPQTGTLQNGAGENITSATLTGGTVTTSNPLLDMTQTWNDAGETFTSLKLNVTDTASASGSLLLDLQVGGSSFFRVDKAGRVRVKTFALFSNLQNGGGILFDTNVVMGSAGLNQWQLGDSSGGTRVFASVSSAGYFQVDAGHWIGFGAIAGQPYNAGDVRLYRDAAQTLAQRNSTNAQTFNIYNTYTDVSNYERGFLKWNSNVLEIGTEALGTGTLRGVKLGTASTSIIGFYDATAIVQPTTGVAEAAFVENSGGTAVNVDSTFGGYTLQQITQALQNLGLLA